MCARRLAPRTAVSWETLLWLRGRSKHLWGTSTRWARCTSICGALASVWLSEAASCTRLVLPEIPVADSAHHNASPNPPVEWFIDDSSGYLDLVTSGELETDAEGSPGAWLHGGDAERFAQVQMTWKFFFDSYRHSACFFQRPAVLSASCKDTRWKVTRLLLFVMLADPFFYALEVVHVGCTTLHSEALFVAHPLMMCEKGE